VLRNAIRSALDQDIPNKVVCVVDDASTDDTPVLRDEFPDVKWHGFNSTQGCRAARNLMMSESDADLFCSLDDDSWFMSSDALRRGVELFERDANLAALGFEILDQGHPVGHLEIQSRRAQMFVGCGHLLRLDAVRKVGLYHDLPGEYGSEEKDLSLRLLDAGFEVLTLQGVHVWHDKSFNARDVPRQHASGVTNDLAFTFCRAPLGTLWWIVPAKIASHLRFAIAFGLRDVRSLGDFDRQIREQHGRWVFIRPVLQSISNFVVRSFHAARHRQPVSKIAFREFIARATD